MPRYNKSGRSASSGHRKYRQKIELGNAIVVGDRSLGEIVYCYRFPSRPERVKIGFSTRGLARVAEQSTSFPEKPEVLFVIHDRRAKDMESAFHEALAHRQSDVLGTEWFDVGWKEILSVSPILRKALRKNTGHRIRRAAVMMVFVIMSLMLYAPLAVSQTGLVQGMPLSQIAAMWTTWFGIILSMDLTRIGEAFYEMLKFSWLYPIFWGWKLLPAALASSLLMAPLTFRRRQAF